MKRLLALIVILAVLVGTSYLPINNPGQVYQIAFAVYLPLLLIAAVILASYLIDLITRKKK